MGEISSALTIFQRAVGSVAIAVLAWTTLGMSSAQASESLWSTPIAAASRAQLAERTNELPGDFRSVEADLTGFKYLLTAHNRGEAYPLRVALPLPDGGFQYFLLEPSTLTPELFEASDPDFLLFKGVAEDDSSTRVQFEYSTSFGITARVLDQDGRWFVGPMGGSQVEFSISYYLRDTGTSKGRECGVTGEAVEAARATAEELKQSGSVSRNSGDIRNTYRIVIFTADNYDAFIYDSNKPDNEETQVYQAVGITLARATGIYETELSISFTNDEAQQRQLISSTNNKSGEGPSLSDATAAINGEIGGHSYDVGHVFAGSFRGVAYLNAVCSSFKGGGTTGLSNPVDDPFDVDYFSHELGHQFGGNHSHSGGADCNESWGVEPGSGSTIMGYAGICPPNVQSNSDPYFHSINFEEMRAFVESGGGASCGVAPAPVTGNAIPTAVAGADYTIPHSTPFVLTGSASDSDDDSLTYSWEQVDQNAALFRVYNPVSSPSRYFPKLGQTSGFPETLPNGTATLNFRLTARDGNGGRAWDDMQVAVAASGSGFGVTAVTSNGASADVSWNVDGTDQAPISASQVTFYLSTDSGASYPTEISSAANNGQATINFPGGIQSNTARLMMKGKDNIFFSTSTVDFSINSVTPTAPTILSVDVDDGEISFLVAPSSSAPVTAYQASCSDGTTAYTVSSAQSTLVLTGLTSGVSYTCSVLAQNGSEQSPASSWPSAIIPEPAIEGLPIWLLYEATK